MRFRDSVSREALAMQRPPYFALKARHFFETNRPALARAFADSFLKSIPPAARSDSNVVELLHFARAFAILGRQAEATAATTRAVQRARRITNARHLDWALGNAALVEVLGGRRAQAVAYLEALFRRRGGGAVMSRAVLSADPVWAHVRDDPRIQALLAAQR